MSRRRPSDKDNRSPSQRPLRVGEEIRHLLAELLERGNMRDPDLRDATITVTSVDVSPDLRNAIAFVMPLGGKDTDRLLSALRRFKDEVREVQHGFECGMAFENYDDIKVGDVIECFDIEAVQPTL